MAQLEITFTRFLQNEPNFPSCVQLAPAAPATMCDQVQADTADTLWLTKGDTKTARQAEGVAHSAESLDRARHRVHGGERWRTRRSASETDKTKTLMIPTLR
jgi:hypothetical protein